MTANLDIQTDARGVATVWLNRADLHNAFDDGLIADLTHTFAGLGQDPTVRIVVLAGRGRSFSAGADLNWMRRMASYGETENYNDAMGLARLMQTLDSLPKPTIARVQGAAFGGGVGLVACCDLAVAAPEASFCLSEVKLGLIPAVISPYVIGKIGKSAARRYFLTAERFNAEEALRLGLIHDITPADSLDDTVEGWIAALLGNGPQAMAAAKRLIANVSDRPVNEALIDDTAHSIARIRSSAEGKEGVSAFLEKRSASWVKPH
ncbi:enoyl-CoA hydratase/isomerase family protein [Parachitinimonas caeni]|uniref:Enoyl-CoA hydratase/isomerase family protein n=1 Tax=Parachitinimonas caeni TaxID=3031301 RepID=A0ABT7E3A5_9NEIS|nr:enoyl-CoA hydratase/isomerase family protein [Parachitinimonas caeni]MDK2125798.1 enoyl-CoA hydratase/isomerase family protein [Parachitinimonas caeni]